LIQSKFGLGANVEETKEMVNVVKLNGARSIN